MLPINSLITSSNRSFLLILILVDGGTGSLFQPGPLYKYSPQPDPEQKLDCATFYYFRKRDTLPVPVSRTLTISLAPSPHPFGRYDIIHNEK